VTRRLALAGWALAASTASAAPPPACLPPDPCQLPARPGETSLVFIGDSGYGLGGASEWGSHAQAEVAARLEALCPRPDLVFFLGDNIYWRGSPDLFAPRFDTVYQRLLGPKGGRIRAALGNHDVKGCRLSDRAAVAAPRTCADALVELVREDVRADAEQTGTPPLGPWINGEVLEAARAVPPRECFPAYDNAYEQSQAAGNECFASAALRHTPFGYGQRGGHPLRYYSVDWPPADGGAGRPRVRVLVADSNTLDIDDDPVERLPAASTPADPSPPPRHDRLQALWIENQLRTAPADVWTMVAMHHPIYTPRACAFKLLGNCIGGHGDEEKLRPQLWTAFGMEGPRASPDVAPDLFFGAHNHFYARSHPLDATGYPAQGPGAIRHFVTGGGGAPLYRGQPLHERFAAGGSFHHFVYLRLRGEDAFFWAIDDHGKVRDQGCFRRGETRDGCIARGTYTSADLTCDPMPLDSQTCPPAAP
jgi:calcineurin-like phosphoesterase family protein